MFYNYIIKFYQVSIFSRNHRFAELNVVHRGKKNCTAFKYLFKHCKRDSKVLRFLAEGTGAESTSAGTQRGSVLWL